MCLHGASAASKFCPQLAGFRVNFTQIWSQAGIIGCVAKGNRGFGFACWFSVVMPKLRMYDRSWIAVIVFFASFGISRCQNYDVSNYECENVKKRDSIEVSGNNPGGRLLELHIRHNLKVGEFSLVM